MATLYRCSGGGGQDGGAFYALVETNSTSYTSFSDSDIKLNSIDGATYSSPTLTLPAGKYTVVYGASWTGTTSASTSRYYNASGTQTTLTPATSSNWNIAMVDFDSQSAITVGIEGKKNSGQSYLRMIMMVIQVEKY